MRGRKMKTPKSLLIVVGEDKGIISAARNLPGVDVVEVQGLNAELLAPGTHAGRLVVWSMSAIERLEQEALFN
jgi:large subunit ribosomal protein L4e